MTKKTTCINFYAGPGAGKSTVAASVFAEFKKKHINCELITEFAKRKVWEGNTECLNNQLYITAKQQYLMWTVSKHVDLIITDSPLLLGCIYDNDELLSQIIVREYNKYNNIDIFLHRNTEFAYQSNGRMQSLEEAIEKDNQICGLVKTLNPNVLEFTVHDTVVNEIILMLSKMEKE